MIKKLFLVLCILLFATVSYAQVEYSSSFWDKDETTSSADFTSEQTIASVTNGILIVSIYMKSDSEVFPSGITWNGDALTQCTTADNTWYLLSPDSGTHDLVVSRATTYDLWMAGTVYEGVAQTAPDVEVTDTGTTSADDYGTVFSTSLTTETAWSMVHSSIMGRLAYIMAWRGDGEVKTLREPTGLAEDTYSNDTGLLTLDFMSEGISTITSYGKMFYKSDTWVMNMIALAPATAPSGGIDSDTVLMLKGDLDRNGEHTKDGSLEIMDSTGSHVVTQVADAALQTTTVKVGSSALGLDGTGDYVLVSDSAGLDVGTGDYSIEAWINTSYTGANGYIFGRVLTSQTTSDNFRCLVLSSAWGAAEGKVRFLTADGYITSTTDVSDGAWHHLEISRSSGTVRIFIDGTLEDSDTFASSITGTTSFIIGAYKSSTIYNYMFNGSIDEFRFSNVARHTSNFTPSETAFTLDSDSVFLLHMDTQDVSGDGGSDSYNIPTFEGDAQIDTAQTKFGEGSYLFDGTGDYIAMPDASWMNFGSSDFTIDTWIRLDTLAISAIICSQGDDGVGAGNNYSFLFNKNNGLQLNMYNGSWNSLITLNQASLTGWAINTWYHVALERYGNEWNLYKDGVSVASTTTSFTVPNYTTDFVLGVQVYNGPTYGNYIDGYIDEFRVSSIARYEDTNFTPPTVAYSVAEAPPVGGRRFFIIAKTEFKKLKSGGYDREYNKWQQNFGWNGIEQQLTNAT